MNLHEFTPAPDQTPVPQYRVTLMDCALIAVCSFIGLYILITGLFSVFMLFGALTGCISTLLLVTGVLKFASVI